MEYIGYLVVATLCTVIGFLFGKLCRRKLSRKKVLLDLETFEYLHERDNELWEIEKAERAHSGSTTFIIKHKIQPTSTIEASKS